MAQKVVTVRYNSSPTRKFELLDEYGAAVNITGYTFKMIVKPFLAHEIDGVLPDARAWFDKTGAIITAASGTFKFDLTPAETCLPPGTYPGEIRWWSGSTANPPTDSWSIDYVVEEAADVP